MDYYFKPSAVRDLKKLPQSIRRTILDKLDFYTKSVNPLKFAKSLKDKTLGEFRFRIGDWRVVFDVEGGRIIILKVGHRKNIYS